MKIFRLVLPLLLILPFLETSAQCRSFTKKKCLPQLEGYVQNENFNSAILIPGDEAELMLTFYADKEYRLIVCNQSILGDIEFEILDTDEELIYSNARSQSEDGNIFDFKVASTQQLIVRIRVPDDAEESTLVHQGCVSVMVGSKEG